MKIAIVTGASSGIGREFVKQLPYFYKNLDEIWVIARRRDKLLSLTEDCLLPLRILDGDILDDTFMIGLKEILSTEQPDVRMLVNAAGFGKMGAFQDICKKEPASQSQMIDLNCRGLTQMTALSLPYMSRSSRIVNLASAAAFCPQPTFAVYAATKSYVLSFSRALAGELKAKGVFVTAVCPGPVNTEFFEVAGSLPNRWKDAVMVDSADVVHKALADTRKRKQVSVYGFAMKAADLGAKIVPHRLIIHFESPQRKKER